MSLPTEPRKVLYFVGFLAADADAVQQAESLLAERWGPVILRSGNWPFSHTDYYVAELGQPIQRSFAAFGEPMAPDELVTRKHFACEVESALLREGRRRVNIDPGYIAPGKLVLSSFKDFAHRIYVDRGVYLEMTLYYKHGAWAGHGFTFRDYLDPQAVAFFTQVRERLLHHAPLSPTGGKGRG